MKKTIALAAVLAAATIGQAASAAPVVTSSTAYGMSSITGPYVVTFDADSAPYKLYGAGKVVSGSLAGVYAAPAVSASQDDATNFLAAFPAGPGSMPATLTGFGLASAVTFYWGSIDAYNSLDFYSGSTLLGSIAGSAASLFPNGDQDSGVTNRTVSIASDTPFDKLVFNTGQNAFEADSFSFQGAVPEPATWAMMVLGFGLAGFAMRSSRRKDLALAA